MVLWRLSGDRYANIFNGGYGLINPGRWNTVGHAVTYCSTSPSLCVLEKLVHIEDPALMPALTMVRYNAPDDLAIEDAALTELPEGWRAQETWTQARGDRWHKALQSPLLRVPSAVVPLGGSPDLNVLINHRHPSAVRIQTVKAEPFVLDARLF
jgi:RES domain-containing protein